MTNAKELAEKIDVLIQTSHQMIGGLAPKVDFVKTLTIWINAALEETEKKIRAEYSELENRRYKDIQESKAAAYEEGLKIGMQPRLEEQAMTLRELTDKIIRHVFDCGGYEIRCVHIESLLSATFKEGYESLDRDAFWNAAKKEAYEDAAKIVIAEYWNARGEESKAEKWLANKIRAKAMEIK